MMSMHSAVSRIPASRQRGQAAVLSLLLLGAALLAGLMMYESGRQATGKIALQNAADAAAFSVSTLEARDLNFMAYTNRSMLGNQISIGQFVGLAAWSKHIASIGQYLQRYVNAIAGGLNGIPIVGQILSGIVTSAGTAVATGITTVGNGLYSGTSAVYKAMGVALKGTNTFYSNAQNVYHYITVYLSLVALHEIIPRNDPNASLSGFGFVTLLVHESSYLGKFATRHGAGSSSAGAVSAFARFAAAVQEARDPFLRDHSSSLKIPLIPAGPFRVSLIFSHNGGGELRYVSSLRGDQFNWSAADTSGGHLNFSMHLTIPMPSPIPDIHINFDKNTPDIPLSSGTAQAGKSALTPREMLPNYTNDKNSKLLPTDRYGKAPQILTAWNDPILGVPTRISANNIDRKYTGLNSFTGVNPYDEDQGFMAPYLLIGLTKATDKLAAKPITVSGQFKLGGGQARNKLASLSKSEVYFARPNDLSYFKRADGKVELGNTYNPYWQARLVDTTYADRALALLIQQGQVWIPGLNEPKLPSRKDLCSLIQKAGLKC